MNQQPERKELRIKILLETDEKIRTIAKETYRTVPSVIDAAIAALYERHQQRGADDIL